MKISRRLEFASVAVIALTILSAAVFGIVRERRAVVLTEAETAATLLDHLASMLGPTARVDQACEILADVSRNGSQSGVIRLVPASTPRDVDDEHYFVTARELDLSTGKYRLEYQGSRIRMRRLVQSNVTAHALLALLSMIWLVAITEVIVRRRLEDPLRSISHQIRHMSRGGGWIADAPLVDGELTDLRDSFSLLGPSLAGQMSDWLAVERRIAVALEYRKLRRSISERFDQRGRTESDNGISAQAIESILDTEEERALHELGVHGDVSAGRCQKEARKSIGVEQDQRRMT